MCTTISDRLPISGSGKGTTGWFSIDHAYVGYDHPTSAPVDHAILLDFVNESSGPAARVAVELTLDSARKLVGRLTEAVRKAEAYDQQQVLQVASARPRDSASKEVRKAVSWRG